MMILELMQYGDLESFLISNRLEVLNKKAVKLKLGCEGYCVYGHRMSFINLWFTFFFFANEKFLEMHGKKEVHLGNLQTLDAPPNHPDKSSEMVSIIEQSLYIVAWLLQIEITYTV